ncbi:hypothetical protein CCHR01_08045 [Colletotrichum chrysophilum]|uniref:Uncharacterized protein n=1 Tax=Colletotrichum chrysophilum TaxID=1836956 RepID=A0AAD9AL15_9PEZI|nr:hypothetical protein CCHR01_08045 [Colletotrichum chrysophilum]
MDTAEVSAGLSTGAQAGIGIGVGVVVIALATTAYVRRRRAKSRRNNTVVRRDEEEEGDEYAEMGTLKGERPVICEGGTCSKAKSMRAGWSFWFYRGLIALGRFLTNLTGSLGLLPLCRGVQEQTERPDSGLGRFFFGR